MILSNITRGLISNPVGNNLQNEEEDVLVIKSELSKLGLFDNKSKTEPNRIITRPLDNSIKNFQKERGLFVDGLIYPKGETEDELIKSQKVSSTSESERFNRLRCNEIVKSWNEKKQKIANFGVELNSLILKIRDKQSKLDALNQEMNEIIAKSIPTPSRPPKGLSGGLGVVLDVVDAGFKIKRMGEVSAEIKDLDNEVTALNYMRKARQGNIERLRAEFRTLSEQIDFLGCQI